LRLHSYGLGFRCRAAGPPDGPLALLLHGFPEGAESWRFQLEALGAQGLRAVAPDLRGYGGTVLEGAGHWLQFERPAEVSRLLIDWIRSHAEPPPVQALGKPRGS
jgi:pimeloyl-ACP methyl ester carboxylesterase